ncbi:MAG: tripartite tricarboxylate transporter substrate binding protein [bacterium]|nr:tripartite tricarboxylate transporter substrate binding protein [bacterium]MDT8366254.1 tripartite tricarboxylate transporter substrate binding protein [bacterium]
MQMLRTRLFILLLVPIACIFLFGQVAEAAWPTRPVEFTISAGAGGGADKYARFLIGLNVKGKYISEPIIPVNKPGGAGAVAMQAVLGQKGNGYQMLITLNSFITTPLFQKLPFTFRDFTPIALLAVDNFPLWVPVDSPFKNVADFIAEAKKRSLQVGGTGSKQEDEIVFRALESKLGLKPFKYVPFKGGGDVAKALVGKHIEASVNQVSEAGGFFPEFVRPLCVFQDERLDIPGYENVPTGKESGIDFSYEMMRAIFAPPGISKEAQDGLVGLFEKISNDPAWVEFASKTGLKRQFITGDALMAFAENYEKVHIEIMKAQGWLK